MVRQVISSKGLLEHEKRLKSYKYEVLTRWINCDSLEAPFGKEYSLMLATLHQIDPPISGRIPAQESWYLSCVGSRQLGAAHIRRYKVRFKQANHATLFKLQWV